MWVWASSFSLRSKNTDLAALKKPKNCSTKALVVKAHETDRISHKSILKSVNFCNYLTGLPVNRE